MSSDELKIKIVPTFDEFRDCVLAAYAPIMNDMGFIELDQRRGEFANEFIVRLGNATTVIEVSGIGYGIAAWTKIFRVSDEAEDNRYGLPINELLRRRQGTSVKDSRRRQERRRKSSDQLGDVRDAAEAILNHAGDVLLGDFSALDEIVEQERLSLEKQRANALPPEAKAAVVAAAEAGHAFKRGDYRKVIALLEPHLPNLTPSQRKRFEAAQRALAQPQP